jgi:hypothetical protein
MTMIQSSQSHTTLSRRIDNDRLTMMPREVAAADVFEMLDGVRNESGERVLAAASLLFAAVSERYAKSPEELFHLGRKMLTHQDKHHRNSTALIEALRDYCGLQLNTNPFNKGLR